MKRGQGWRRWGVSALSQRCWNVRVGRGGGRQVKGGMNTTEIRLKGGQEIQDVCYLFVQV